MTSPKYHAICSSRACRSRTVVALVAGREERRAGVQHVEQRVVVGLRRSSRTSRCQVAASRTPVRSRPRLAWKPRDRGDRRVVVHAGRGLGQPRELVEPLLELADPDALGAAAAARRRRPGGPVVRRRAEGARACGAVGRGGRRGELGPRRLRCARRCARRGAQHDAGAVRRAADAGRRRARRQQQRLTGLSSVSSGEVRDPSSVRT